MRHIHTCTVTHRGDPKLNPVNGVLELGVQDCMRRVRLHHHANVGDWVVAKVGRSFKPKMNLDFDNNQYLFYAMEVTDIKNKDVKRVLCSSKGNYYCFFENPVKIDPKFHGFLPQGEAPRKIPFGDDSELENHFIEWIKSQTTTSVKPYSGKCPKPCDCT